MVKAMRFLYFAFCFLISAACCVPACMALESKTWLVDSKKMKCVLENIKNYQSQRTDPVVIYLDLCPVSDPEKLFEMQLQNTIAPNIVRNSSEADTPEKVLILSKAELDCLSLQNFDFTKSTVRIPRKPCQRLK